jgi:hypothetical protein
MITIDINDNKISENLRENVWDYFSQTPPPDRPRINYATGWLVFKYELHTWFIENNIKYSLTYSKSEENCTQIHFEKESDALLFKLTWG